MVAADKPVSKAIKLDRLKTNQRHLLQNQLQLKHYRQHPRRPLVISLDFVFSLEQHSRGKVAFILDDILGSPDFDRPFLPPPWTTTDDRLRGGASQSFLIALPHNGALFYGHLDIATLGGAGFASQYSPTTADDNDTTTSAPARGGDAPWDLTAYAGLEIRLGPGDGKLYTLILKDAENRPRGLEGRETAGFSWEAEFRANAGQTEEQVEKEKIHAGGEEEKGQAVWLPWDEFKPTFRGRETQGGEKLDQSNITTVGIMMRSYFGTQEGDFKLEVESITARKGPPEVHSNGSEEG